MTMIKNIFKTAAIAALTLGLSQTAFAAQAVDLDQLLQQVREGRVKDAAETRSASRNSRPHAAGNSNC